MHPIEKAALLGYLAGGGIGGLAGYGTDKLTGAESHQMFPGTMLGGLAGGGIGMYHGGRLGGRLGFNALSDKVEEHAKEHDEEHGKHKKKD